MNHDPLPNINHPDIEMNDLRHRVAIRLANLILRATSKEYREGIKNAMQLGFRKAAEGDL